MSELLGCPFCGSPAEYYGECDMVWVRCSNYDCEAQRICKFDEPEEAAEDWNRRAPLSPATPLTIEQLREMDGRPVFVRTGDGEEYWSIVMHDGLHFGFISAGLDCELPGDEDFYAMYHNDPAGHFGLHVLGWLAFDRQPESEGGKCSQK